MDGPAAMRAGSVTAGDSRSAAEASCSRCGSALGREVWLLRERKPTRLGPSRRLVEFCGRCAADRGDAAGLLRPCASCGRLVGGRPKRCRGHAVCCERCRWQLVSALRREHRAARRYVCASCGHEFRPTRADMRFCSGRCRQRAHRQRTREAA